MTIITRFLGLQIAIGLFVWMVAMSSDLMIYVDIPSLIIVLGVSSGLMLFCFTPLQLWRAINTLLNAGAGLDASHRVEAATVFGRAYQVVWGVGLVGTLFGLISMLADLGDPSAIGAGMAVALIMVAYSALLAELIIAPCKQLVLNHPHLPSAEPHASQVEPESLSEGSMMWKGVTVVSLMIAVFFIMVVSFSELNKETEFEAVFHEINKAFTNEASGDLHSIHTE